MTIYFRKKELEFQNQNFMSSKSLNFLLTALSSTNTSRLYFSWISVFGSWKWASKHKTNTLFSKENSLIQTASAADNFDQDGVQNKRGVFFADKTSADVKFSARDEIFFCIVAIYLTLESSQNTGFRHLRLCFWTDYDAEIIYVRRSLSWMVPVIF